MRNAYLPSRVQEPHTETAYTTDCALDFMRRRGGQPWTLHLSYVKPHWPYMAPDPYHRMYGSGQCLPVARTRQELENAHPVLQAYRQHEESQSFARDECVRIVRPAYQGLISQLDTHLGGLFDYMEGAGLMRNTLIVFTSDHGDFLGDHWLGEKELFYDTVQRVPLIVADPAPAADATRGQARRELVEAVDILPTILQALDVPLASHRLEGRALQPLLHDAQARPDWRQAAVSELDYSFRHARLMLGKTPQQARAWSVRTDRWRYVYWLDEPEQLYDLQADPGEFQDLGTSDTHAGVRAAMRGHLLDWSLRGKRRTTMSDDAVERGTNAHKQAGVYFGQW